MVNSKGIFSPVFVLLLTLVHGDVLVEKGYGAAFQCQVPNTVSSVTWRLTDSGSAVDLSTCSFVTETCADQKPSVYKGSLSSSSSYHGMTLNIISAMKNETQFSCVTNDGLQFATVQLEVYSWPHKPQCSQTVTNNFVEYTCTTDNVYPGFRATLHRREADFKVGEIDSNNTFCNVGNDGSGTEGDFKGTCTFRIPMENMLLNNTVYVEMIALVTNVTLVHKPPADSNDITTVLSLPEVNIPRITCPLGSGTRGQNVLIGTHATCKCVLSNLGFPNGFARWYNKQGDVVGVENISDGSSTVTFAFNGSDPTQSYDCWPITPLNSEITYLTYTPSFRCSYTVAEKGKPTTLQCPSLYTANTITWQLSSGTNIFNISTCTLADNKCTDLTPSNYQASISNSANGKIISLTSNAIRVDQTVFYYLTDAGIRSPINELEIYAWPKKPICIQGLTNTFVEHTCTTDNVYPGVDAVLNRREIQFVSDDYDMNYTKCTLGNYGSGTEGDYSATCTWRIPMTNMVTESHIYASMSALLSNQSLISRAPSNSDDYITELSFPEIVIYRSNCPVGPGVRSDSSIQIGTVATCKCEIRSPGVPPGFARWFTANKNIVGTENVADKSSTLTLAYNPSDPNASYTCYPISPLIGTFNITTYTPAFS